MTERKPTPKTDLLKLETGQSVVDWLSNQGSTNRPVLLAFADDGVIWSEWAEKGYATLPADFSGIARKLRDETLQQAFVFGADDEVRLFKNGAGEWSTCLIEDDPDQDSFDEIHILWGNEIVSSKDGFVHLRDKVQQGMDQLIPLELNEADLQEGNVPRLKVRHFVEYDNETGEARVFLSRLVMLGKGPAGKEELQ